SQTFDAPLTNVVASDPGQLIWIQAPATVTATGEFAMFTDTLALEGTLIANPATLVGTKGVGNIVSTVGDGTLPNNLIFHGQNLAIMAAGNILGGGVSVIDLSGPGGGNASGNLLLLAGFNLSPTGFDNQNGPPGYLNTVVYTVGTPSGQGGSIS